MGGHGKVWAAKNTRRRGKEGKSHQDSAVRLIRWPRFLSSSCLSLLLFDVSCFSFRRERKTSLFAFQSRPYRYPWHKNISLEVFFCCRSMSCLFSWFVLRYISCSLCLHINQFVGVTVCFLPGKVTLSGFFLELWAPCEKCGLSLSKTANHGNPWGPFFPDRLALVQLRRKKARTRR